MKEQNPQQKDIRVCCVSCGKEYRLRPNAIGKKAKCCCGHIFVVSTPTEENIYAHQPIQATGEVPQIKDADDVESSSNEEEVRTNKQLVCQVCGSRKIEIVEQTFISDSYRCNTCLFRGVFLWNPEKSQKRYRFMRSFMFTSIFFSVCTLFVRPISLPFLLIPLGLLWRYYEKCRFYTEERQLELVRRYKEKIAKQWDVCGEVKDTIHDIVEGSSQEPYDSTERVGVSNQLDFLVSEKGLTFAPKQDYSGSQDRLFIPWYDLSEVTIKGYYLRVKYMKFPFNPTLREEFLSKIRRINPQADKELTYVRVAPPYRTASIVFAILSFIPMMGLICPFFAFFYFLRCREIWKSDQDFWNRWGRGYPPKFAALLALVGFVLNFITIIIFISFCFS